MTCSTFDNAEYASLPDRSHPDPLLEIHFRVSYRGLRHHVIQVFCGFPDDRPRHGLTPIGSVG